MTINDAIVAVVGRQINEGLLAYYRYFGANSHNLQDAERQFLLGRGAIEAPLNDMWMEMLRIAGYTGSLNDMALQYWLDGGIPMLAPIFSGTIGGISSAVGTPITPYDASTHFATGGVITEYSLQNAPAWMSIDDNTGVITGTPDVVASVDNVTVTGSNLKGDAVSNTFSVTGTQAP